MTDRGHLMLMSKVAHAHAWVSAQVVIQRAHELMMQHLAAVAAATPIAASGLLMPTCATLRTLQILDASAHDYVSRFTGQMVKLFSCIEREHTNGGMTLASSGVAGCGPRVSVSDARSLVGSL